jgi:hypothetical protein
MKKVYIIFEDDALMLLCLKCFKKDAKGEDLNLKDEDYFKKDLKAYIVAKIKKYKGSV